MWLTAVVGWIVGLLVLDNEMGAHRNGRALESGFDCSVFGSFLLARELQPSTRRSSDGNHVLDLQLMANGSDLSISCFQPRSSTPEARRGYHVLEVRMLHAEHTDFMTGHAAVSLEGAR